MSGGPELSWETRERLADFLKSLTPAHARALARAVEQAREAGDAQLPHGFILDALDPLLRQPGPGAPEETAAHPAPAAPAAPEDLFRRPFEDLLVARGPTRGPGRIAGSSVAPVWHWLCEDLLPPEGGEHAPLRQSIDGQGGAPSPEAVARFQRACGRALAEALADESGRKAASVKLGGAVLEDAGKMAAFLEIAEAAREVQERFPRPAASLSLTDLNTLVVLFDDFVHRHPDRVAHFFFVVLGRLQRPWDVLHVMAHVAGRVHPNRPGEADTDAVMDRLLSDLEASAEFFRCLNTTDFEAGEVADELRVFTRLVNGISRAISVPPDGPWARRIMTCRSLTAEKMEIMMERVPRDILAALPVHKIGRFGRVRRRPDIGSAPDRSRSDQALRMAELVNACRPYAADAAFKVAFSEAVADAREGLSEYANALIEEIKRLDADSLEPAEAYLDLVLRLTAHVCGSEETGRLRRETAALRTEDMPGAAVS